MSNLDTFYNKKRNFPDAEEREFDDLSPIPATLYRVGVLRGYSKVVTIKGRHDPCIGVRAVVVVEAMAATVILDFLLRRRCDRI